MQPFLAQALVEKLHEAGIPAEATEGGPGVGNWIPGLTNLAYTVWVLDPADLKEARRLLQEIEDVPKESEHCEHCGYDLRGHVGEDECPECGTAILVNDPEQWWTCQSCGEQSPPTTSDCWKCAGPAHHEPEVEPERPPKTQKDLQNKIFFWIFMIFLASVLFTGLLGVFNVWF